ncbi:DUF6932 family protein [Saccharothrix hoggarensis]|uniref:DUF6932 family protein n=1 Tax=Saccharothrix hoggarensis TaxID=913853 RepID=A0ABW3QFG2_9PSEU
MPELGANGHLPPGRYRTSLEEVQARFVDHDQFVNSATRRDIWQGFQDYLAAWLLAEEKADVGPVLQLVWLAGSFISGKLNPDDLDVTPVIDRRALVEAQTHRRSKALKRLIGHRTGIVERFKVEPFVLEWEPVASTLRPTAVGSSARDYLERRGSLDDWWQRLRAPGPKGPSTEEEAPPRRGYLEVAP